MPPTVDPTSGIPVMGNNQSNNVVNSTPSPQNISQAQPVQYQQTPQQMHQQNLFNSISSQNHQNQPQMMNTLHGTQMVYPHMQKSKLVMLILAIFLGWAGGHNFYLGFTSKAVAQLLISILSFGLLIPVSSIWALIEGVVLFGNQHAIDSNGIPLKD
ncbi:MAG: hypothetical protein CMA29_00240 [Euryarchaeota archaeon]|nr:hypothetical protein [Euryarchaeota archaeon]